MYTRLFTSFGLLTAAAAVALPLYFASRAEPLPIPKLHKCPSAKKIEEALGLQEGEVAEVLQTISGIKIQFKSTTPSFIYEKIFQQYDSKNPPNGDKRLPITVDAKLGTVEMRANGPTDISKFEDWLEQKDPNQPFLKDYKKILNDSEIRPYIQSLTPMGDTQLILKSVVMSALAASHELQKLNIPSECVVTPLKTVNGSASFWAPRHFYINIFATNLFNETIANHFQKKLKLDTSENQLIKYKNKLI